jgi:hypothetical protein
MQSFTLLISYGTRPDQRTRLERNQHVALVCSIWIRSKCFPRDVSSMNPYCLSCLLAHDFYWLMCLSYLPSVAKYSLLPLAWPTAFFGVRIHHFGVFCLAYLICHIVGFNWLVVLLYFLHANYIIIYSMCFCRHSKTEHGLFKCMCFFFLTRISDCSKKIWAERFLCLLNSFIFLAEIGRSWLYDFASMINLQLSILFVQFYYYSAWFKLEYITYLRGTVKNFSHTTCSFVFLLW